MTSTKKPLISRLSLSQRTASVNRVLWTVLLLNLVVASAKYVYGYISGSASMQADGIHSFFDSAGNIVGIVGISIASRPADTNHPYGHAKFETYASLIIGVLLIFAAIEVGSSAIGKLLSQTFDAQVSPISFIVMGSTLCVNIFVARYERKQGILLKSEILIADASHTFSDVLVSIGVIVGLILVALGFPMADPILALLVMVAILITASGVFQRALKTLSDNARIPEDEIKRVIEEIPGVERTHQIRTRGTEGEVYMDLHLMVAPTMTVLDAHRLCDKVEGEILEVFPQVRDVLVHIEPEDGHEE